VPAQPIEPTTVWNPDNVVITWTSPDSGGSPIIGYFITIRQSDNTYSTDLVHCDQ